MSLRSVETEFDRALSVVRRSQIAPHLEDAIRSTSAGRPRRLSVEMLLAALLVAPNQRFRSGTLVTVHRILTDELSASRLRRSDLMWDEHGQAKTLTIRQVRYLFKQIVRAMDFSPHTTKNLDVLGLFDAADTTHEWLNALVRASLPDSLPVAEMHAIDASAIPAWSRGKERATDAQRAAGQPATASVDPDADWGYRTVTTDSASEDFFGYHLNAAVTSYTPGSPWQSIKAIAAFDLVAANAGLTESTINLLDDALLPYAPGTTILVDRGYSNWVAPAWADQLHARGVTQYLTMYPNDLKIREDPGTGVIMFAGWPYSPWTPRDLFQITAPRNFSLAPLAPNAAESTRRRHKLALEPIEEFHAKIAALAPYALKPNGRRKANGDQRFLTRTYGRENANAAQRRTAAFRQETVTISSAVLAKLHQPHRWGTPEWIAAFSRRTAVEGAFGVLKNRDGHAMTRGWTRAIGITANALMVTAAIVQYNIQVIRRWAAKNALDDAALYDAPPHESRVQPAPREANSPQRPGAPPRG
ncbi:hypothetical protein ACTVCO_07660 [Sanguibacter sp. A247]|uniref:hypothetical protein n=1 Tax=unclassified Sanguibacter TaxID=2645534 RepID=UPI003FD7546C